MATIKVSDQKNGFQNRDYPDLAADKHAQSNDKRAGSCWQYYDDSTGYFPVPKVLNNDT